MLPLSRYLLTEEKPYEALQDFCDDMAIIKSCIFKIN